MHQFHWNNNVFDWLLVRVWCGGHSSVAGICKQYVFTGGLNIRQLVDTQFLLVVFWARDTKLKFINI